MLRRILFSLKQAYLLTAVLLALSTVTYAQTDSLSTDPAAISAGKSLFDANCKACHKIHEKLVGPALAGVYDRAPSVDWIKSFIKNPARVIQSGDAY